MLHTQFKILYDSDSAGGGPADGFTSWLADQPEDIRSLVEGHISSLKHSLSSERETRKSLTKQLREMAAKPGGGGQMETQLQELSNSVAEKDRMANFFDAAHQVGISNLRLAYIAAVDGELFDKDGNADFNELKKLAPDLFPQKKIPDGSAGEGTEKGLPVDVDMNANIRRMSGRKYIF